MTRPESAEKNDAGARRHGDAEKKNVGYSIAVSPRRLSIIATADNTLEGMNVLQGLVTAFRTLTIFPVPGQDAPKHSGSLPFFPLVGLALGFLLWAISLIDRVISGGDWPMGVAGIMLLASVISTRSLHLDGLADLADAVGGGWDRARRLEIMKDSRLGVFGAVAIIITLLCKWVAFTRLVAVGSTIWVVLIFMVSRAMQVNLAVRLDYARSEGGTAASFVRQASGYHRAAAFAITLVAALVFGILGLVALTVAELITWLYGGWCRKNIGGITGDLLGAGNEIVETVLLLLAAAPGSLLLGYTGWSWVFH
ncbi:MAG: adenosylcobinamide-GDP ribazoletransferase [Deltaproteobacteria bacterium]|nr:MAG: adenosylcobinamide-GDP ribazoletransferase [Deltaproteobacteria bacterium]